MLLEVCVDSLAGCEIATHAGADRIELSENLSVGGTTPSAQLTKDCLSRTHLPIIALVRCRAGDFVYNRNELDSMLAECDRLAQLGVAGFAVGAATPIQSIPQEDSCNTSHPLELHWGFLEAVAERFSTLELVVHRVFDRISQPVESLSRLADIGFQRVLTGGQSENAWDGRENLRLWQTLNHVEILPAGGIHASNAQSLLSYTGCCQLHGSLRGSDLQLPSPSEIAQVKRILQSARR